MKSIYFKKEPWNHHKYPVFLLLQLYDVFLYQKVRGGAMALYTYCLSARKAVALENIELEGLSETELAMVKLERVREVLFQVLLLDDVKFEDGKMYAELCTIYIL